MCFLYRIKSIASINDDLSTTIYIFINEKGKAIFVNSKNLLVELQRQNIRIEKLFKRWGKEYNKTIRVLVLGNGETGKSTFIRSIRAGHNYIPNEERLEFFYITLKTLQESMIKILNTIIFIKNDSQICFENFEYLKNNPTNEIKKMDNYKLNIFYDMIEYFWLDLRVKELVNNASFNNLEVIFLK